MSEGHWTIATRERKREEKKHLGEKKGRQEPSVRKVSPVLSNRKDVFLVLSKIPTRAAC